VQQLPGAYDWVQGEMHMSMTSSLFHIGLAAALAGCAGSSAYETETKQVAAHLTVFDDLDFNVFSNQRWEDLHKSHAREIKVHWPDGHVTEGIDRHIDDLKAMFVYAPDTRIKVHPIKFGSGEWTSVVGVMEGTFTQPMPTGDGKSIPPTGKAFKLGMATIGHWTNGTMDEEYLFWDNATYMHQLGL
jgi:hypothetical protein